MSSKSNGPVRIDSRKFLSAINDSAQAKVAVFEERIGHLGKAAGKNWRLAALHAKQLYIEDVNSHEYFVADHHREAHGKVSINNIRPLEIVESEKKDLFSETCIKLVNSIEENDQKGMQVAFDRMKAQRFSGRAVPFSGVVKCRDGVLRHINILPTGQSLAEDVRANLISAIVEGLQDRVIVENGEIVSGTFGDGEEVNLPVTKWASRKLVARRMMEAAKNAYWSKGFQDRVYNVARLVSESKIETAVKVVSPFLNEMEEFTLLNRQQIQTLVENALASKAIFNQQLCNDTATLLFRTNMKISRNKIIDEWRNIAKKSENAILAENVNILEESQNFESAYQKFLSLIFETISNREIAAEALATTLDILKNKTPKIRESHDLSSKLNNLIYRLKDRNCDDSAIYEAEDLIATIQEELAAADSLQNFDQMPGGQSDDLGLGAASPISTGGGAGGSAPVININSPLIQIGGQSSAAGEAELGLGGEEEMPEGEDADLDELLAGSPSAETPPPAAPPAAPAPAPAAGAPAAPAAPAAPVGGAPRFESRISRKALNESRPVHYEMKDEDDDDMPGDEEVSEGYDPYALNTKERSSIKEGLYITDYGAPVITDEGDMQKIISIMHRLANEHKLSGKHLERNIPSMAKASIKALGIRIPEGKISRAIDEIAETFMEAAEPFPGAAPLFKKKDHEGHESAEHEEEEHESAEHEGHKPWESEEEEGVAEDQYHHAYIPHRGYGRASLHKATAKKVEESKIVWKDSQDDALLGEMAGVNFIFDHGGSDANLKPVILSEDGSVEIPVPEALYDSAFAAADMARGDSTQFKNWLAESIEQLRPIYDDEDVALNEAMAKITTNPDGSLAVEISGEVDVTEAGEDIDAEVDDMKPVDSVDTSAVEMGPEDVEIDFEKGESLEDNADDLEDKSDDLESEVDALESETDHLEDQADDLEHETDEYEVEEGEVEEEEEEEEGFAEDNDVTSPTNAKYTKHVKENLRSIPSLNVPKATDDELEDLGPTVKKDDGTGTKPPVARKGN